MKKAETNMIMVIIVVAIIALIALAFSAGIIGVSKEKQQSAIRTTSDELKNIGRTYYHKENILDFFGKNG